MKPEWWTNGKACSRIPRVIEIWREQGCEVTPLYSGAALLDAHQRGRREGLESAEKAAHEELERAKVYHPEVALGAKFARDSIRAMIQAAKEGG